MIKYKFFFVIFGVIVIGLLAYLGPKASIKQDYVAHETVPVEISDIYVEIPKAGSVVSSPILMSGQARGYWYFEASAPVDLMDSSGNVIAGGYVTAKGDWMTENFVPFEGVLEFTSVPASKEGILIFKNSNASGEPEFDKSIMVPVLFE
jgi:hypothetical protein